MGAPRFPDHIPLLLTAAEAMEYVGASGELWAMLTKERIVEPIPKTRKYARTDLDQVPEKIKRYADRAQGQTLHIAPKRQKVGTPNPGRRPTEELLRRKRSGGEG